MSDQNHSTPLAAVVIDSAGELQAVANFAKLLYLNGSKREWSVYSPFGKLWYALNRGEESQVLPAVEGAKAEIAGHPYEAELIALIDVINVYVGEVLGSYQFQTGGWIGTPFHRPAGSPVAHRPGPKLGTPRPEQVVHGAQEKPMHVRMN